MKIIIFIILHHRLDALGYCYTLGDDVRELLEDYWNLTGFEGGQNVKHDQDVGGVEKK